MQSSSQITTTNKPTSSFFTGRMPFLSPNQQCQSSEGKISHSMDLLTSSSPGVFQLCLLTTNNSWLPRRRVAMPLISPLMSVPQHLPTSCALKRILILLNLHNCGSYFTLKNKKASYFKRIVHQHLYHHKF